MPCGSCIGCRKARAREWAYRCWLEAGEHYVNSWCTLTYDDLHLPPTLQKHHLTLFFKRLRRRVGAVRFFACGEYGGRTERPHYHAILFGVDHERAVRDSWRLGFTQVDTLTPAAISYVAGYASKKLGVRGVKDVRVDYETGEEYVFQPPFVQMSRRPGVGAVARKRFVESFGDFGVFEGRRVPVPRYFREYWRSVMPKDVVEATEARRREAAAERVARGDLDVERLRAGAAIEQSRLSLYARRKL